ncbi:hypothetical protein PTKIN_Ptkin10aG0110500 [Pterospermum kingtungense]
MDVSILLLLVIFPLAASQSFNFTSFDSGDPKISYKGDATPIGSVIQLTKPDVWRSGHAMSVEPMHLWDKTSGSLADFTTHFSFSINAQNNATHADGLAFFIASLDYHIPDVADGSGIGLASGKQVKDSTGNPFVAVEFDTYHNDWDPEYDHVGIDINSLVSNKTVTWYSSVMDGKMVDALINYNSSLKILNVSFTGYNGNTTIQQNLQYEVDFRDCLSEWAIFGFSSATGVYYELNVIYSWYFSSNLQIAENKTNSSSTTNSNKKGNNNTGLVVGFTVGSCILLVFLCLIFVYLKKRNNKRGKDELFAVQSMNNEFERVTGAKKKTLAELIQATNNFAEAQKLGEGGFGAVYRGFLKDQTFEVAVKRISTTSHQGIKEYASEVMVTSRLRHKNLVQLIGWCHEKNELLLVYEYMPNGSLDSHLFGGERLLTWTERYTIAQGLASSLHYLHFECDPFVLHRDIKASNVLLDSSFNAKLGDFGLARIVGHEKALQSTKFGGTFGYLAPEYAATGRASQETDVYSFGIVALEITCGRKPILLKANGNQISIVEWLWEFYKRGKLMEAVDPRLQGNFDEQQMERLMILGLCCAHPDFDSRPSMKEVIAVLNFDVPLPSIPLEMPVPNYFAASLMSSYATGTLSLTQSNSRTDPQHPSAEPSTSLASSSISSLLSGTGTRQH